jgi:hypothetical protein
MNIIKLVSSTLIVLALVSCKDEKKETVAPTNEPKEVKGLQVTFDLVAKKDDNFHLYYTEDESVNFTEEKSSWLPYKGKETVQEVTFVLPEEAAPTNLRVDFGHGKNPEQSDIVLKSFRLKYYDKTFEAKDSLIFNYFYPNKDNTLLDNKTATLKRLKQDQETAPCLYPHTPLTDELKKLIRQ